jgi:hypothetical protein
MLVAALIHLNAAIAGVIIGIFAPDLWQGLTSWFRRPRHIGMLLVAGLVAYSVYVDPRVLGMVLGIAIIWFALKTILGIRRKKDSSPLNPDSRVEGFFVFLCLLVNAILSL